VTDDLGEWHRLHPLSPLVRAGAGFIALVVVIGPRLLSQGIGGLTPVDFAILIAAFGTGLVLWLVTRWRLDGSELQIETGLVRRSSRRFALSRIQAIDVVRPGLARVFGLAEVRLRMGGATGAHGRLAYLRADQADALRARLLDLARGAQADRPADELESPEQILARVPTPRLVASILLAAPGLMTLAVLGGAAAVILVTPDNAAGILGSATTDVVVLYQGVWRRFNGDYRLTIASASDGLRVRSGLIALTAETIRPGRIQAVRMTEPLLWRPFGWCRLEVDIAGRQRAEHEGEAESRRLRTLLPAGTRAEADRLLNHLIADRPGGRRRPPRRARLKSPLRYGRLSWDRSDSWVVTTSGRVRRVTAWVPLVKAQSLRRIQGPVQRRLRLTTIHIDTAGRSVHATLRDRDVREGDAALAELVELARRAREAERKQPPVAGAVRYL
jgi:putative membrane protein